MTFVVKGEVSLGIRFGMQNMQGWGRSHQQQQQQQSVLILQSCLKSWCRSENLKEPGIGQGGNNIILYSPSQPGPLDAVDAVSVVLPQLRIALGQ